MPKLKRCRHCGNMVENLTRKLCQRRTCYKNPAVRAKAPNRRPMRHWTMTELARLQQMHEAGATIAEIAEAMGRTKDSVDHASARYKARMTLSKIRRSRNTERSQR